MDMQAALLARLIADAALQALAADRISWVERPQGEGLPALTLQTVSGTRDRHMQGPQATRRTRVQLDAWAPSYAEARALIDAAVAAVAPADRNNGVAFAPATFENERDLQERTDTDTIYRTSIDLIVWHSPA